MSVNSSFSKKDRERIGNLDHSHSNTIGVVNHKINFQINPGVKPKDHSHQ